MTMRDPDAYPAELVRSLWGSKTVLPSKERGGCSEEAGIQKAAIAGDQRGQIARFFFETFPAGHTADEVAAHFRISPFSARPRISELHAVGLIRKTNERRRNRSAMTAAVWIGTSLLVGERAVAAAEGCAFQESFLDPPSLVPGAGINGGAR